MKRNLFGLFAGVILAMGLITALMAGRRSYVPPPPAAVVRGGANNKLRLVPNACPCEPGCNCDGECQCEGKR